MKFRLSLIGGTLAYPGTERDWQGMTFFDPSWRALTGLVISRAVAAPALARLARHGTDSTPLDSTPAQEASA